MLGVLIMQNTSKSNHQTGGRYAIATLSFAVTPSSPAVQLMPAGAFRAADGRPQPWGSWKLTPERAADLVAQANARANKYVIDYEHQTQLADKNGQPAPAAGWFKTLEFRPGQGLFATDVQWTARAKDYLAGDEYKYISPVFEFDKTTGEVLRLLTVALVNDPGLQGMDEVVLAALSARFHRADDASANSNPGANHQPSTEKSPMNPILLAMLKALGLPEAATETDAVSAIAVLKSKATSADALTVEVATLKTAAPDPARYVPIEKVTELNTTIVQLKSAQLDRDVDDVINKAKAEGRLVPALEEVWRQVGKSDIAQLKKLVEATPANPALAGRQQSGGKGPDSGEDKTKLSEAQLAICKNMGLTTEQFIAAGVAA